MLRDSPHGRHDVVPRELRRGRADASVVVRHQLHGRETSPLVVGVFGGFHSPVIGGRGVEVVVDGQAHGRQVNLAQGAVSVDSNHIVTQHLHGTNPRVGGRKVL